MYVDTGGADTSGLFPRYQAKPEAIESRAEELDGYATNIQAFSTELDAQHQAAVASVSGVIAHPLSTAAQAPSQYSTLMMGRTFVTSGSIRLFGQGIQRFNTTIDTLNDQYRQAQAADFGVLEADYPEKATLAQKNEIDGARDDEIMGARVALIRSLKEQYLAALALLDQDAGSSAAQINAGPTDETLQNLYAAGVLPTSVALAYPNLALTTTVLPPDIADLDPAEAEEYLRAHPEVADSVVNGLLTKDGLTDLEQAIVEAQARIDGELLNEGLGKTGQEALDDIAAAQARLQLVNDHVAQTGVLNDAAHSYTFAWMNEVGSDNLAKLPSVVQTALGETMTGVPQDVEGLVGSYLSPVGDAILNLSNETYQDTGQATVYRYDFNGDGLIDTNDMPKAIRELVTMRIGENENGMRWGQVDDDGHGSMTSIENLDKFNGWVDLLHYSTVDGGEDFSVDLGEQAIQAKQDMNAILVKGNALVDTTTMTQQELDELRATLDDSATSDLLSITARNEDASSALLLDDVRREEILGLNWNDSDGAADIIHAGTDRDDSDGAGGTQDQADAALAVFEEVAGDGTQYLARMPEGVSDAVVDVGITWMDSFTHAVGPDEAGVVQGGQDAIGRELPFIVNLSDADQASFLEFVAGTDDHDALRFRTAANVYSSSLIAEALHSGHAPTVNQAMYAAGRLDGAITAADYEYGMDIAEGENREAQAAHAAEVRRNQGIATFLKTVGSITSTVGGKVFPPAGPFLSVGNALAGPIIDSVLTTDDLQLPHDVAQERADLINKDSNYSKYWESYMLLTAADQAGIEPTTAGGFDLDQVYTTDDAGNRVLRDYEELSPEDRNALNVASDEAFQEWERKHPGQDTDPVNYDEGRGSLFTGWPRADRDSDGWGDDRTAEERLYGDNVPEGYGDDPFEDGPREQYPDENHQIDPTKKRR